jgi:hypothetical protein
VSPGHLGVTLDLSPAGLIQHAIQSGQGAGEDWEGFKARHKQVGDGTVVLGSQWALQLTQLISER